MVTKAIGTAVRKFISDEAGLESVEYAIIAGLLVVAAISTIASLAVVLNARFEALRAAMTN